VRYFTIVGQFDVLVGALGPPVRVPRQVFDPDDEVDTLGALVSEIGSSERHFRSRSRRDPESTEKWSRLLVLRQRTDIEVLDLTDEEDEAYTELRSAVFTRAHGLAAPLGKGEAAVIAIAEHRGFRAVMDDGPARRVLNERSPGHEIMTTRDVLRVAASEQVIDSAEAQLVYDDMLAEGYRGPDQLW
jgi:predicted nucleic acid-binding protein